MRSGSVTRMSVWSWWTTRSTTTRRHSKYLPYAFTEHGELQVSNVLRSDRAIQVSIAVVEAFVRVQQILSSHAELAQRLNALKRQYHSNFKQVFTARGVMMLSFVLRTELAVQSSVFLIRTMEIVSNSPPSRRIIRRKLLELERQVGDSTHPVRQLLAAVNRMLVPPRRASRLVPFPGPFANGPR
jgi:hypothetical protein